MNLKYSTILVEDNCTIISNILKEKLLEQEYKSYFFDTSFEAENLIRHNPIDLVVISNLKFLKELRKKYTKSTLPVLFLTKDVNSILDEVYENANDFLNIAVINEDLLPKITLTLNRCHKVKNLIELTNRDYLTNTYNKRYFYEAASRAYQTNNNIAICMIDIDNFKHINDKYGHIVGDYAIKELANTLKSNTKGKDIVARFGGDEFCLFLQDISEEDTNSLIHKIKREINETSFKLYNTELNFTISVGVATTKTNSLQDMINHADLELLKEKEKKHNVRLCTNYRYCGLELA